MRSSDPAGRGPKMLAHLEISRAIFVPIIDLACYLGASSLHGLCFYAPATSIAAVVLR